MREIDHVFVLTDVGGGHAAARLEAEGFVEGPPNTHPGQGTANRRYFFARGMLELLWVTDADEARSTVTAPTHLDERWSNRGREASPFGICFASDAEPPAFPGFAYRPGFLPAGVSLHVGANAARVEEPLVFALVAEREVGARVIGPRAGDALDLHELRRARVHTPSADEASATIVAAAHVGPFEQTRGPEHLLDLGFDGERAGRRLDLRPELPITISW